MAAPLLQTVMSTSDGFDHSSLDSHSGTRLGPGQLALTCLNSAKWWCTWPVSAAATSNARKYAAPSREAPTNSRAATAATTPGTQRDQPDLGRPPATRAATSASTNSSHNGEGACCKKPLVR